jgi:hypothetical protein
MRPFRSRFFCGLPKRFTKFEKLLKKKERSIAGTASPLLIFMFGVDFFGLRHTPDQTDYFP